MWVDTIFGSVALILGIAKEGCAWSERIIWWGKCESFMRGNHPREMRS